MSARSGARSRVAAVAISIAVFGGCSTGILGEARPGAQPCLEAYGANRCEAIALAMADELGLDPALVTSVIILPPPEIPEGMMDRAHQVNVRITLADGGQRDGSFSCPGVSGAFIPRCMPEPHLVLHNPVENGYRDYPENATPVPEVEPAAAAEAVPLTISRLEIPIDAPGPQRVKVGQATLPNGILTETRFATEETWPSTFVLRGGNVTLEVVSADRGDTLWNLYEHGWVDGVEKVDVYIVFDAGIVRPGATLVIVGLAVS